MGLPNIINDIEYIKSNYLPSWGGVVYGDVICTNDSHVNFGYSYGSKSGGLISFRNKNCSVHAGGFDLYAQNTEATKILTGLPDGTLTWNGYNIITSNGGTITNTIYYGGHDMYCDKDNDIIAIYGSTHHTIGGASLVLHGGIQSDEYGESNISAFKLSTHSYDLSKKKTLYGQYDRGLMWDGNQVVCLVTHWQSGNRWYRKYSNGWIEQGGNWSTANTTLSFNTPFSNTNYTIVGSENQGDDNARAIKFNRNNATTTSIRMVGSANPIGVCWYACGY